MVFTKGFKKLYQLPIESVIAAFQLLFESEKFVMVNIIFNWFNISKLFLDAFEKSQIHKRLNVNTNITY